MGEVQPATRLNQQVYEESLRTLGEAHSTTLAAGANLAVSYLESGRPQEGAALLRGVVITSRRVLGAEHPATLATQLNFALALRSVGEEAEAAAILGNLLASSERTLGLHHPTTDRVRRVHGAGAAMLEGSKNTTVLPVYLAADVSASMAPVLSMLNNGLQDLVHTIAVEPILKGTLRFGLLTFSEQARWRMSATGLTSETQVPRLEAEGGTNYGAAFRALRDGLERDIAALKESRYSVRRPLVFFLTDGQPTDHDWRTALQDLKRLDSGAHPTIVAFGLDGALIEILREVASRPEWALEARPNITPARVIHGFMNSLTATVVTAGTAKDATMFALVVPEEFTAI